MSPSGKISKTHVSKSAPDQMAIRPSNPKQLKSHQARRSIVAPKKNSVSIMKTISLRRVAETSVGDRFIIRLSQKRRKTIESKNKIAAVKSSGTTKTVYQCCQKVNRSSCVSIVCP